MKRVLNELAESRSAQTSAGMVKKLVLNGYIAAPYNWNAGTLVAGNGLTNAGERAIGVN